MRCYWGNPQGRSGAQSWEVGKSVAHNQKQTSTCLMMHLKGTYIQVSVSKGLAFKQGRNQDVLVIYFVLNSCLANKYSNVATHLYIFTNSPFSWDSLPETKWIWNLVSLLFSLPLLSSHPSKIIFPHSSCFLLGKI